MSLTRDRYGAPEPCRRWVAPEAVALVRPMFVVEADKAVEAPRQCGARGEVAATKLHAPVLLQDRALQPLDKAIGPGVARLGPGVPNAVSATGLIERAVEFAAAVGEDPLNRTGRNVHPPAMGQVRGKAAAAPRRLADRDAEDEPFERRRELARPAGLRLPPARVQAVGPVALQAPAPPVEQGAGDPQVLAHAADATLRRLLHDAQPQSVYLVVQGHRSVLPSWFPCQGLIHSGNDRPDGPLIFQSEVSTPFRPARV